MTYLDNSESIVLKFVLGSCICWLGAVLFDVASTLNEYRTLHKTIKANQLKLKNTVNKNDNIKHDEMTIKRKSISELTKPTWLTNDISFWNFAIIGKYGIRLNYVVNSLYRLLIHFIPIPFIGVEKQTVTQDQICNFLLQSPEMISAVSKIDTSNEDKNLTLIEYYDENFMVPYHGKTQLVTQFLVVIGLHYENNFDSNNNINDDNNCNNNRNNLIKKSVLKWSIKTILPNSNNTCIEYNSCNMELNELMGWIAMWPAIVLHPRTHQFGEQININSNLLSNCKLQNVNTNKYDAFVHDLKIAQCGMIYLNNVATWPVSVNLEVKNQQTSDKIFAYNLQRPYFSHNSATMIKLTKCSKVADFCWKSRKALRKILKTQLKYDVSNRKLCDEFESLASSLFLNVVCHSLGHWVYKECDLNKVDLPLYNTMGIKNLRNFVVMFAMPNKPIIINTRLSSKVSQSNILKLWFDEMEKINPQMARSLDIIPST